MAGQAVPAVTGPARCPKCGSPSWDGEMCYRRGCEWMGQERDPKSDPKRDGEEATVSAKEYRCKFCNRVCTSPQALAGHTAQHRRRSPAPPAAVHSERPQSKAKEAEPASCLLCGTDLSPFARNVATALRAEGIEAGQALRSAAIAQRALRGGK